MSSTIKPLVIIVLASIGLNFFLYRVDYSFKNNRLDDFSYAVKVGTQDATAVLIDLSDLNNTYDGRIKEYSDISVNFENAEKRFFETLYINLGVSKKDDLKNFSNMNIPLTGVVGYRYILGKLYDGNYTFPMSYNFYDESNKRTLSFTLGDTVYIKYDNSNTEVLGTLDSIGKLSNDMSNVEFRNYIVTDTINDFLTMFSTDKYNLVSKNLYTGLEFNLAHSDYTSNKKLYNKTTGVIDSVGFFAVIDTYYGSFSKKQIHSRIFSFGGSELLLQN